MSTLLSRYERRWERARLHEARGRGTAREGRERVKREGQRERGRKRKRRRSNMADDAMQAGKNKI